MMPTSARRQVEPVDVDDGVQRHRRDQAAAVEPLRDGDPRQDRALAQGADRITGGERGGRAAIGRAQARVGERADERRPPRPG